MIRQIRDGKWGCRMLPAVLAAGIIFALPAVSGCAKKPVPAESQTVQETEAQAESSQAPAESAQEETTAANPHEMPELKSEETVGILSGTVKDATMNTVIVANEEYPDGVAFSKEDAGVNLAGGLLIDHKVTVLYRGEIGKEKDASVMAELVRDERDGDQDREAGVISGEVMSVGMSVITIRTSDGTEISFEQDPKPVNLTSGPLEGDKVMIYYSCQKGETVYAPELIAGE